MTRRPARTFGVLAAVAVAAMVVGVVIGQGVRSPEQQALDTAPPEKTLITAPVTERPPETTVVARGTVAVGQRVSVGPVKASAAVSTVTAVFVKTGDQVKAGSRLIEVSGRPVLLLSGDFGAYRDLLVGDQGPDARQLNQALSKVGLAAPDGDTFTSATSAAFAELYRKVGYSPPAGGGLDRREVVFVAGQTAMVAELNARVGGTAEAERLVTLSSGSTTVQANFDPAAAKTIKAGDKATLFVDREFQEIPAQVSQVQLGATLAETRVTLKPEGEVSQEDDGADVRVEVTVQAASGATLSVPSAAVYSQPNGQPVVVVLRGTEQIVVAVTVANEVGGFLAVASVEPGALAAQDQVIVSGPGFN